ncbi:hypothetical protein [Pseudoduganella sp. OTU4001]|uniref:hypothetical protein n=1 Tax=Pseudoduganella sp. OTU4001 TaxID=3043854 RepID=UPI00313C44F6
MTTYRYYRRAAGVFGSGPSSISFNGRQYMYRGYAYDKFIDAYHYAQLMLLHPTLALPAAPIALPIQVHAPAAADRLTMRQLGVAYAAGRYFYGPYRYDCLNDACDFARLHPGQELSQPNVRTALEQQHMNQLQQRGMLDGSDLKFLLGGRLGHYDIFPQNAPVALTFKLHRQAKPLAAPHGSQRP